MHNLGIVYYKLNDNDLKVFETACEQAIFYGNSILYISDILPKLYNMSISENEVFESLENLCELDYFKKKLSILNVREFIFYFSIEHLAFEKYLRKYYKNYNSLYNSLISHIQLEDIKNLESEKMAEKIKIPKMIINHFCEEMHLQGFIKLTKRIRGNWFIEDVIHIREFKNI